MSQGIRTDSAEMPHLEDLYGRIGIAAVAAAARYKSKDEIRPAAHHDAQAGLPFAAPAA
jgi:hypothetical protein